MTIKGGGRGPRNIGRRAALLAGVAWALTPLILDQPAAADLNNDRYALPAWGSELVSNGTFNTDISGWTFQTPSYATWSSGSQALALARDASNTTLAYSPLINTEIGKLYQFSFSWSGASIIFGNMYTAGGTQLTTYGFSGTSGTGTGYFTATSAQSQFYIANGQASSTLLVDNVSVKEVRLFDLGPELVTNGTFNTDLTGWSYTNNASYTTTWSASAMQTVRGSAGSIVGTPYQTIAGLVVGSVYQVSANNTGANGAYVGVAAAANAGTPLGTVLNGASAFYQFTATATSMVLQFWPIGDTQTIVIDNVSVKLWTPTTAKRSATFADFFAFTAASTTARTYVDATGVLRDVNYGRTNLLTNSNDPSAWALGYNANIAFGATVAAPTGLMVARSVSFSGSGSSSGYLYATSTASLPAGSYTGAVWVRSTTGKATIGVRIVAANTATNQNNINVALTSAWTRVPVSFTLNAADVVQVGFDNRSGFGVGGDGIAGTIEAYGISLEPGAQATPYTATTTAAVDGTNAQRFDYTNGKRQLLLENASTNLIKDSINLASANWSGTNTSATASAITARDGSSKFYAITNTAGASGYWRTSIGTTIAGAAYTLAADVTPGTARYVFIQLSDFASTAGGMFFDTVNKTVVGWNYNGTVTITNPAAVLVAPNVYRVSVTITLSAAATFYLSVAPTNDNTSGNTAVSGQTAYATFVQCEQQSFPSSIIHTAGAAVTRAIETARFSPLIEAILQRSAASVVARGYNFRRASGRIVGADTSYSLLRANSGITNVISESSGGALASTNSVSSSLSGGFGAANGFDSSGRSVTFNQNAVGTDALAETTRSAVYLGRDAANTAYGDGWYDFVGIAANRLADTRLQALAVAA